MIIGLIVGLIDYLDCLLKYACVVMTKRVETSRCRRRTLACGDSADFTAKDAIIDQDTPALSRLSDGLGGGLTPGLASCRVDASSCTRDD